MMSVGMEMKEKIKKINWMKELPAVSMQKLSRLDWIISLLILAFLFVTFFEGDIIVTGNRSFLYYKGFFQDFYKASYEQSQGFYANYLPSTFLAFAVWNLPLYLLGRVPGFILQDALLNLMWYKLLPVILYFVTSHLIYKIGMLIGFGEEKSKICKFAFLICPIAVYSQFIFSQYDIFMVFFMVLGLYYYFKGGLFRFVLFLGIAATFKYQALAYFAVLLVLKEKKFRKLALYGLVGIAPVLLEIIPNMSSPYFYRCVLGFHALSFVDNGFEFGYISGISLILGMGAFLMVWAYIKKPVLLDELVSWALYFATGVSFTIFAFSRWNPQWFLVMIPFLVLSIFRNRNGKMFVLITNIFIVALYIFSVNQWRGIADQTMMKSGIFKFLIGERSFATSMADVYGYSNLVNLGTCIFVILLVFFVFNHPKYQTVRKTEVPDYMMNYLRVTFLAGAAAFLIPAGICLASAVRGEVVFADNTQVEAADCGTVNITDTAGVRQVFTADGDVIESIRVRFGMHNRINDAVMHIRILDQETQEVVYEREMPTLGFVKEESMYQVTDEDIEVTKGKEYVLELQGSDGPDNCVATYYFETEDEETELAVIDGMKKPVQIIMEIRGVDSQG